MLTTRAISRASLVVAVQNYLGESEAAAKNASMPGYLSIGMSGTFEPSDVVAATCARSPACCYCLCLH